MDAQKKKIITEFGFHMIVRIMKDLVCVIWLSLLLWQVREFKKL